MSWEEFVAAARSISWIAYLGTVDISGAPHVSVVAPGFTDGSLWFATRRSSKKYRNVVEHRRVAFHWAVGGGGPGELVADGTVLLHDSDGERRELWGAGVLDYDPAGFFGSPENPDVVFVEVLVEHARLLGPDFVARRWRRHPSSDGGRPSGDGDGDDHGRSSDDL